MRRKIVLAATAGALTLGGLAVAVPAMAEDEAPTPTSSSATAEERVRDALSGLVDDGSLTQEQADEVASTLTDAGVGPWGGHDGRGWGGGAWGAGAAVAAETLGLSEDELRAALEAEGATLASVAEDQGVPVSDLVAALVGEARERIATAVEEHGMPQERADEVLADLETRATEIVESADLDGAPGGGRWGGPWGWDRDGD